MKKLWEKICEETDWNEEAAKSIAYRMEWQRRSREEAEALQEAETPDAKVPLLRAGRLRIDTRRRRVWFDNQPLDAINLLEYALLCCIATTSGQVVTYRELCRRLQTAASVVIDERDAADILSSHLWKLQAILGGDVLIPIPGVGYLLSDRESPEEPAFPIDLTGMWLGETQGRVTARHEWFIEHHDTFAIIRTRWTGEKSFARYSATIISSERLLFLHPGEGRTIRYDFYGFTVPHWVGTYDNGTLNYIYDVVFRRR